MTEAKSAVAQKKPLSKSQQRKRTLALHKWVRIAVQIAFFILAPGVFSSAMSAIRAISAQLGSMQAIEVSAFFLVLVATLAYTVLFGRFFCGYACAFGTMGDILYLAGKPIRTLIKIEGKPLRGKVATVLSYGKFVVLVVVCVLCFFNTWDKVSAHDPWTVFGLVVGGTFTGLDVIGIILLVLIMVFQMLFERSFCRFLCPMGAVFSLMPVLPISQFGRKRERCAKRCDRCIGACPAGIYPDKGANTMGECFECGRCADVCPMSNVHLIDIDLKSADNGDDKPKKKRFTFTGTGVFYVLVRTALLLVLLWLVGATRFLPSAVTVFPNLPWS